MNEQCPQCGDKLVAKSGISKAGKPYSGIFCSNRDCDYKEWGKATPGGYTPSAPASNPVVDALREIYKQNQEHHEALTDILHDIVIALGKP